mmetsp:Transcript_54761/g.159740  ORF Transcript_54761/g.159740 Transcript_54761/m.159740 type:complete len:277 (+) Transcript_54761:68-898(+)
MAASSSIGASDQCEALAGGSDAQQDHREDAPPITSASKTNESLPDVTIRSITQSDICRWTLSVMQHYQVPVCFLALEGTDGMYLKGRHGLDTKFLKLPSICHHATPRELPVIVCDARHEVMYRYDELVAGPPHGRFFVGVPLLLPGHRCIGTLCIMDPKPRDAFALQACSFLVHSAGQIAAHLCAEVKRFLCPTAESLGSVFSANSGSGGSGGNPTMESLPSVQLRTGTLESLASFHSPTLENLAAIPESAEGAHRQAPSTEDLGSNSEEAGHAGG